MKTKMAHFLHAYKSIIPQVFGFVKKNLCNIAHFYRLHKKLL